MATPTYSGPVDFAVFVVPAVAGVHEGLRILVDRVDQGLIELLDLEIIGRTGDGPVRLPLSALASDGFDLTVLDGAESDILEADDLAAVADDLEPDQLAIVVVYEDRSLAPVAAAFAAVGGTELWSGGIDINNLEHSLDVTQEVS